jgi:hypothetical protein
LNSRDSSEQPHSTSTRPAPSQLCVYRNPSASV